MNSFLPQSFSVSNVPPAQQKMGSFDDSTLFYIFYTMSRDVLQEAAAQELYNRNWRYHKDVKVWFTKDSSNPMEFKRTATFEQGRYVVWDVKSWKRVPQSLQVYFDQVEERQNFFNNGQSSSSLLGGIPTASTMAMASGVNAPTTLMRHHANMGLSNDTAMSVGNVPGPQASMRPFPPLNQAAGQLNAGPSLPMSGVTQQQHHLLGAFMS